VVFLFIQKWKVKNIAFKWAISKNPVGFRGPCRFCSQINKKYPPHLTHLCPLVANDRKGDYPLLEEEKAWVLNPNLPSNDDRMQIEILDNIQRSLTLESDFKLDFPNDGLLEIFPTDNLDGLLAKAEIALKSGSLMEEMPNPKPTIAQLISSSRPLPPKKKANQDDPNSLKGKPPV